MDLVDVTESLEELNLKERYYINVFKLNNQEILYNLSEGRDGGNTTSGRIKITDGQKERCIQDDESIPDGWKRGCITTGANNWNSGKRFLFVNNGISERRVETTQPIPDGFVIGRMYQHSEQTKEKISQYYQTHKHVFSESGLKILSDLWVGENNPSVKNKKYGDKNPFLGGIIQRNQN